MDHRATPTTTELALHCCILWLAGHHHSSIHCWTGILAPTSHNCAHGRTDSIDPLNLLGNHFPTTHNETEEAARGFWSVSSHNLIEGCVAAIGGMPMKIKVPGRSEVGNVKSPCNGHHQACGVNMQAACDHRRGFAHTVTGVTGSTNEVNAHQQSRFPAMVGSLPRRWHAVGDNVRTCDCTETPSKQSLHKNHEPFCVWLRADVSTTVTCEVQIRATTHPLIHHRHWRWEMDCIVRIA